MESYNRTKLHITGLCITSAIGQGKTAFAVMQRPGRQQGTEFLGAEIPSLSYPEDLSKRTLRTASLSRHAALITLLEAWEDAKLTTVDPSRIGLIIG